MDEACKDCRDRWCKAGLDEAMIDSSYFGHEECLAQLLEKGADVNACDHLQQMNALEWCCDGGNEKCLRMLINAGADLHANGNCRTGPLHHSCNVGSTWCAKILLESGADVNEKNPMGNTAWMLARYTTAAKLLLRNKCQINSLDCSKCTLPGFHNCAHIDKPDLLRVVYAAGEQINCAEHKTPEFLTEVATDRSLKHQCRQAIRKHLLHVDKHSHLFYRVPLLGLPSPIQKYLLFNETIADVF